MDLSFLSPRFKNVESDLGFAKLETYQAMDCFHHERLVHLVIIRDFSPSENLPEFHQHLEKLLALNHPNIQRLYDYHLDSEKKIFWFTSETFGCENLLQKNSDTPFDQRCRFALEICAALSALHTSGLTHGHLHDQNILIDSQKHCKVIHAGLKNLMISDENAMTYLAPELILGQAPNYASDLYALGIFFHQLFIGQNPFASDQPKLILQQHLSGLHLKKDLLSALPEPLAGLITALLQKNPAKRPLSSLAVFSQLQSLTKHPMASKHSPLGEFPLLEREKNIQTAEAILKKSSGLGLAILGEKGSGKTRMAGRLKSFAHRENWQIVEGNTFAEGFCLFLFQDFSCLPDQPEASALLFFQIFDNSKTRAQVLLESDEQGTTRIPEGFEKIHLAPLSKPATYELVKSVLGLSTKQVQESKEWSNALEWMFEESKGNPLRLKHCLLDLLDSRALVHDGTHWALPHTLPSRTIEQDPIASTHPSDKPNETESIRQWLKNSGSSAQNPDVLAARAKLACILSEGDPSHHQEAEEIVDELISLLNQGESVNPAQCDEVKGRKYAQAFFYLGVACSHLTQSSLTLDYLSKSKNFFRIFHDPVMEGALDLARALELYALGDTSKAIHILQDTLGSAQQHTLLELQGKTTYQIGQIYFQQGNLQEARLYLEKAIHIQKFFPFTKTHSDTRLLFARLAHQQGDFARALEQTSILLKKSPCAPENLLLCHKEMALIYLHCMHAKHALFHVEKAQALAGNDTNTQKDFVEMKSWAARLEETADPLYLWQKILAVQASRVERKEGLYGRFLRAFDAKNAHALARTLQEIIGSNQRCLSLHVLPATIYLLHQLKQKEQAIHFSRVYREILSASLQQLPEELQIHFQSHPLVTAALAMASLAAPSPKIRSQALPVSINQIWRINHLMNSQASPKDVIKTLFEVAVETLGADRGLLKIQEQPDFSFTLEKNFAVQDTQEKAALLAIARDIMEKNEAFLNLQSLRPSESRGSESLVQPELHSLIGHPLRHQYKVIGSILLDHPSNLGIFTHDHQMILALLCDQASVALRNSHLLDSIIRNTREIEHATAHIEELNKRLEVKLRAQSDEISQTREQLKKNPLQSYAPPPQKHGIIWGVSRQMNLIYELLNKISQSAAPVLIQGESGTGKELLARAIQSESLLTNGPFLSINCAALSPEVMESELFGHVKGAFTGADNEHKGLFEQASGGTLFLDEIGDMPLTMQVKLLRVLQEGEIRRVGDSMMRPIQVRIITASHRNLKTMVREGSFREDLLYRLNVIPIILPPLRDRKEDILPMAEQFLRNFRKSGKVPLLLHPQVVHALEAYPWPGNVRELRNLMENLNTLCEGPQIMLEDLSPEIKDHYQTLRVETEAQQKSPRGLSFQEEIDRFEKAYMKTALLRNEGNVSQSARESQMHRSTFRRLMKRHQLTEK